MYTCAQDTHAFCAKQERIPTVPVWSLYMAATFAFLILSILLSIPLSIVLSLLLCSLLSVPLCNSTFILVHSCGFYCSFHCSCCSVQSPWGGTLAHWPVSVTSRVKGDPSTLTSVCDFRGHLAFSVTATHYLHKTIRTPLDQCWSAWAHHWTIAGAECHLPETGTSPQLNGG